jgi:hypothetical protein
LKPDSDQESEPESEADSDLVLKSDFEPEYKPKSKQESEPELKPETEHNKLTPNPDPYIKCQGRIGKRIYRYEFKCSVM